MAWFTCRTVLLKYCGEHFSPTPTPASPLIILTQFFKPSTWATVPMKASIESKLKRFFRPLRVSHCRIRHQHVLSPEHMDSPMQLDSTDLRWSHACSNDVKPLHIDSFDHSYPRTIQFWGIGVSQNMPSAKAGDSRPIYNQGNLHKWFMHPSMPSALDMTVWYTTYGPLFIGCGSMPYLLQ